MRGAGRILAIGLLAAAGLARAAPPPPAQTAPPPSPQTTPSAPAGSILPIPDAPARWVTDRAAFLSPGFAQTLDAQLSEYARRTGHQVLVYIDRTTAGVPIEDWAVRAFERWRVGRKGIDDGVVLFIFSDDRRVRIEVGYGLEDRVPDAIASRIINERMVPRIRAGDRDGAVREGVKALTGAIGAEGAAAPDETRQRPSVWTLVGGGILALLFVWLLITNPALAAMLILNVASGRRGGGLGGGGGGFSGGGGRSGGGGASGSW